MDENKLRDMAGLPRLTRQQLDEKKNWVSSVVPKTEPKEGTFTKSASQIVKELLRVHAGDVNRAMQALNFYINRAGKKVSNLVELEKAKELLSKKIAKEELNTALRIAGVKLYEEEDDEEEDDEEEDEAEEEDSEFPDVIMAVAQKIGKDVITPDEDGKGYSVNMEKLAAHLINVYNAGVQDGELIEKKVNESTNAHPNLPARAHYIKLTKLIDNIKASRHDLDLLLNKVEDSKLGDGTIRGNVGNGLRNIADSLTYLWRAKEDWEDLSQ